MDIEKTIAFILEQTATNAAQIARNDAQIAALTSSVNALTVAQKKSEKKLEVLGKMVQTGMKLLVKMDKRFNHIETRLDDLAESQKRTEKALIKFIESQRPRPNGTSH